MLKQEAWQWHNQQVSAFKENNLSKKTSLSIHPLDSQPCFFSAFTRAFLSKTTNIAWLKSRDPEDAQNSDGKSSYGRDTVKSVVDYLRTDKRKI